MWAEEEYKPDAAALRLEAEFRKHLNTRWLACEIVMALREAAGAGRGSVPLQWLFARLWPTIQSAPSMSFPPLLAALQTRALVTWELPPSPNASPDADTIELLQLALVEWVQSGTCSGAARETDQLQGLREVLGFSLSKTRDLNVHGAEIYVSAVLESAAVSGADVAVLMPFHGRRRSVYDKSIRPACAARGLSCKRADEYYGSKHIMSEIAALIKSSRIVVSDISGLNANVLYETGIAHAIGKQVLLIAERGTKVPFDILHLRRLEYSMWGGLGRLGNALEEAMSDMLAHSYQAP